EAGDVQMIQQSHHVERALSKRKSTGRIRRRAVAAQVRSNEAITGGRFLENVLPIGAGSHSTMQPEQRLSVAELFPIHLDPIDVDNHHSSLCVKQLQEAEQYDKK